MYLKLFLFAVKVSPNMYRLFVWIFVCGSVSGCVKDPPVYSRVDANASFNFTIPSAERIGGYIIFDNTNTSRLIVEYHTNGTQTVAEETRVTFIGEAVAGNITFTFNNIQTSDAGMFKLRKATDVTFQEHCISITLYVLGSPTTPTIVMNRNPDVGGSVTMTCSNSLSTTTPADHDLSMMYTWTVDDQLTNNRYSTSKHQMILSNVVLGNANRQFACSSTENVTDGLTSAKSSTASFNVYYGPDNIRYTSSSTTIEQNARTHFTPVLCTADCQPQCRYSWTKTGSAGGQIGTNRTLDIGLLGSNDTGVYRCKAINSGRYCRPGYTDTKDLTVNVVYGPINIRVSPSTSTYRLAERSSLPAITCQSDCYLCTYSWTGPVSLTVPGIYLQLGSLSKSEKGKYTCTARNTKTHTTANTSVSIEVMYGPETPTLSPANQVYNVDIGDTLPAIQCAAACFPVCAYTWTRTGQHTSIINTSTLRLRTIQTTHAGVYTCTATNFGISGDPTNATQMTIHVRYGPESIRCNPQHTTYTKNEGFRLPAITCASDCYPSCTYTWTKSNTTVDKGDTLSLGQLYRSEAGTYTVTAVNPDKVNSPQREWSVTIIVRYAPAINVSLSSYNLTENSHLRITCDAQGIPSYYNFRPIMQTFDGLSIPNNNSNHALYLLDITSLQLKDTGTYKCIVNNGIVNTEGNLDQMTTQEIKVIVKPKVLDTTLRFVGKPNNLVNISIPFYAYPSVTSIQIKHADGSVIVNSNRRHVTYQAETVMAEFYDTEVRLEGHVALLNITNLQEADFTTYTLVLTNDIGTTETTFDLDANSIPLPPRSFVYSGLVDGKLSFMWEKDFNGGHTQYFTIKTGSCKDDLIEKLRMYENQTQYIVYNGTYSASIDAMPPGTYYAELSTGNAVGETPDSIALTLSFSIPEKVDGNGSFVAAVAGATCGGFVFVVFLLIVYVLVKRFRNRLADGLRKGCRASDVSSDLRKTLDDHIYINDVFNTPQQNNDGAIQESTDARSQYECLDKNLPGDMLYEMIERQDSKEGETTTYENMKFNT